ncbi:hypothetical protein D3C87_1762540 [compost metagenome]
MSRSRGLLRRQISPISRAGSGAAKGTMRMELRAASVAIAISGMSVMPMPLATICRSVVIEVAPNETRRRLPAVLQTASA